jgi:hypothetical protein
MAVTPFDLKDIFWLDPAAIQKVDKLINSTHLSTMSLGAETRADDNKVARQQLAAILIPENDAMSADLQRALDIGFMYGGLMASNSQSEKAGSQVGHLQTVAATYSAPLPTSVARGLYEAQSGLDLELSNDNYLFFRRLRAVEVQEAGSDILAFCLAATQDHMGAEFNNHRKSDAEFTSLQKRRLQSLYYAGALAGALLTGDEQTWNKPTVEIMRGTYAENEPVSIRMEFEPGDDISAAVEYLLGAQLSFSYVNNGFNEPYVAVLPAGIQFGPNALSMPLHMPQLEEPEVMYKAPVRDIQALVVGYTDAETNKIEKIGIVSEVEEYLTSQNERSRLVGLLLPEVCAGSYHRAHPNASVIRDLASQVSGVAASEIVYSSVLEPVPSNERWSTNKKLGAYAAASITSIWATEMLEYALVKDKSINWSADISVSAIVVAGVGILAYAKNVLKKTGKEHDKDYQQLLDQFTLPQ